MAAEREGWRQAPPTLGMSHADIRRRTSAWPSLAGVPANRLSARYRRAVQRHRARSRATGQTGLDRRCWKTTVSHQVVDLDVLGRSHAPLRIHRRVQRVDDPMEAPAWVSVEVIEPSRSTLEKIRKDPRRVVEERTGLVPPRACVDGAPFRMLTRKVIDHLIAARAQRDLPTEPHHRGFRMCGAHPLLALELVAAVVVRRLGRRIGVEGADLMLAEDGHGTRVEKRNPECRAACGHALGPQRASHAAMHERGYARSSNEVIDRAAVLRVDGGAIPRERLTAARAQFRREDRSDGPSHSGEERSQFGHDGQYRPPPPSRPIRAQRLETWRTRAWGRVCVWRRGEVFP